MFARRMTLLPLTAFLLGIGAIPAAAAQSSGVPIVRLEEPTPKPMADRLRLSPIRGLSWSATQELLAAEDLPAPARPTTFTLTPRNPYRMPGGLIRLWSRGSTRAPSWWQPAEPEPTGSAGFDDESTIFLHLMKLEPNYQYNVDLSLNSYDPVQLDVGLCDGWVNTALNTRVDGAQHLFVVLTTDRDGESCFRLNSATATTIYLYRVDVAELGPPPKSRF